jgi:hypothetical protein
MFGHNAFKPPVSTCLKERGTIPYEPIAELNPAFLIASDQSSQDCTAIR